MLSVMAITADICLMICSGEGLALSYSYQESEEREKQSSYRDSSWLVDMHAHPIKVYIYL